MTGSTIIVSACLLGIRTRHDGKDALNAEVVRLLEGRPFVPLCPEQLGGLSTPRPRAEITGGEGRDVLSGVALVTDEHGTDVTPIFLKGAEEALKIARMTGATLAYLKEKSPSCGVETICRGGQNVAGSGVTAALLKKEGIKVKGF